MSEKRETTGRELAVYDPTDLAVLPDPWLQQPGETDAEFVYFVQYRDMRLPRNMRNVKGTDTAKIWDMCKRNRWIQRTVAYDNMWEEHKLEVKKEHMAALMRSSVEHDFYFLQEGYEFLVEELRKYKKMQDDKQHAHGPTIDFKDMIKLAQHLAEIVRKNSGVQTRRFSWNTQTAKKKITWTT
jgi:hypothetical protein